MLKKRTFEVKKGGKIENWRKPDFWAAVGGAN
jgi:hypothetical protein